MNPPEYTRGQHTSVRQVIDAKQHPPGYFEANLESTTAGEVYSEKFRLTASALESQLSPTHFTVHATESENFVLLSNGQPKYYIDNTSSLSKVIVRTGNTTSGAVISTGSIVRPFVKEVVTKYTSKNSGASITTLEGSGKFSIVWTFRCGKQTYTWKSSKGVMTAYLATSVVATYDVGNTFVIGAEYTHLNDILISTAYAIEYFARMSSDRRKRALNSVTGKSMSGPGALLGGSIM